MMDAMNNILSQSKAVQLACPFYPGKFFHNLSLLNFSLFAQHLGGDSQNFLSKFVKFLCNFAPKNIEII